VTGAPTTQPPAAPVVVSPALRVSNHATAEEVAVIVALFSALGAPAAVAPPTARSQWARPQVRRPLPHGPGAWRASGLPH
jgi:hypothetical protein